jgi:hypothetical protein
MESFNFQSVKFQLLMAEKFTFSRLMVSNFQGPGRKFQHFKVARKPFQDQNVDFPRLKISIYKFESFNFSKFEVLTFQRLKF